jgi:hypothetical protein
VIALIPAQYRLAAAGVLAAVLLAAAGAGGWAARGAVADRQMAELKAEHAQALQRIADAAREEEARQRAEETRRAAALQEIQDAATQRAKTRAAAVRRAAAAGDGLRIEAAAFAAQPREAGADPGAAAGGQADDRAAVLAKLLADVELLGREMARAADEARDAGRACEAAFDSLTLKGNP